LHDQIISLFSIILSPSNHSESWNDIKTKLKLFLGCCIFQLHQIENIQAVSIQHKFQGWFRKNFTNIKLNYVPSDDWSLEMAITFLFQQHFDTDCGENLMMDVLLIYWKTTNVDEAFVNTQFTNAWLLTK
jgi:hypothetical protein